MEENRIDYRCKVDCLIPFTELLPFQGNLKQSTEHEIEQLADSLMKDGQISPYYIWHKPCPEGTAELEWHKEQPHYVIDGHRRMLAVQMIALAHPQVLTHSYPAMIITADTIEEAKECLLQVCSTYGKITPRGLEAFLKDCPKIKLASIGIKTKLPSVKGVKVASLKPALDTAVIKLRIPRNMSGEFVELIKKVSWIEML